MKLFEMIDVNYGIKAGHPGAMFTIGDVYGKQNLNVPHAKLNVQNKNKKKMGIPESIDPTDQAQFINALRDLLPIAMAQLEIEKLPKIKLEKYVEAAEQPTFGRFVNDTVTIHIGIENRHIIDILRTLAHELVHFKQHELDELGPESGRTGSTEENEAHAVAGVIMRHFNLKHPEYFHDPAISLDEAAKVRLSTDPSNFGAYVSDTGSHEEKTVKIPVHKIDVFEPDAKFDEPKYAKNLKKIVNAIKAGKTLPPILVRRMPGLRYQVLDGHHRFKAYRLAGVKSIPARIVAPANVKVDENLRDWFGKEKWVRMDTKGNIKGDCARGSEKEGKPKCLPQAKAHALGKKGRASAARKKRREDPNPDRKGAAINVATKVREETVDEACWKGYHKEGMKTMFGKRYPNCVKNKNESLEVYVNKGECPGCGGVMVSEDQMNEKKDACYHKVKSRYKVWPSAYASGALVQCRKKGASNWGNKSESVSENTTAAGINRALGGFFDPVVANLQRVALLAMQGRQSEAASRLNTAIKTASPEAQKRIIDAVNNIKPVTINGKIADSSTLEKSKEHNEWIIKTFIPWVKSQLDKNDTNEATNGPESKPTMPAGTVRVDVSDVYDWYKLGQHVSNMKGLGTHDFGKGPPSTIISFGSEEEEHKYIKDLEKLGLPTTDIDPKDLKQPKGMKKQPVDPTYNVNEDDSDSEIHNYEKLDNILVKLCKMVTDGQESDKDYGMVAAAVLDPDNRMVARLNRPGKNGKRIHAEHAAIIGYTKQHGDIPEGSIILTTLSPCNEAMDERDGPSCTDLINRTVVKKVYCGYMDPTQTDDSRQFNLMETGNREIRIQCKEFADTFLDHVHENFADGKNPQDKGDSKRYGVPTKASISTLRKFAKTHSGRAAQLAHWAANMKSGKRK